MRPTRSIWQALSWKEWHEHKWKLVSTAAIFLSMIGVSLMLDFEQDTIAIATGLIALMRISPDALHRGRDGDGRTRPKDA